MLTEILGVVEKTPPRPLLIVFIALAISTFNRDGGLLANPFSAHALAIPILVSLAYAFVWGWVALVHRLNSSLADNDIASWGPLIGCSVLAFGILVTFKYLSTHPIGLSFALLAEKNFVRVCALFLFAFETIKIKR